METLNIAIKINKYLRKPRNQETKIKSSPDTVYDKTTMKNILITGGCGFIGSHFLNKNVKKYSYYNFINLDALYYTSNQNNILKSIKQKRNYTFIQGNIQNQELVEYILKHHQIDTIIHLAGQTHLQGVLSSPTQYVKDNILGTQVLLEACRKHSRIKKFIYLGTDMISCLGDSEKSEVYRELYQNISCNPRLVCLASAEMLVSSYFITQELPVILIRMCSVYGAKPNTNSWISQHINLLLENKKCKIYGEGEQIYPFLHLDDVIQGLECILLRGKIGEVYGMVSDFEYSEMEITRRLIQLIKTENLEDFTKYVDFIKTKNKVNYLPQTSHKLQEIGWKQEIFIQEGLEKTVSYYRKKHELKKDKIMLNMEITQF